MSLDEREGGLCLVYRRRECGGQRILEEKVYDLGLPAAGSQVLEQGGEGPDFWAYVGHGRRLYYVSYWLPNKIRVMRVPREARDGLEVLAPHYARIGARLYCRGAWVPDAAADRLEVIPETRFAHDGERVYAFTVTEGLDVLETASPPFYFLPRCEYFADRRYFYWQSTWTGRIERVSGLTRVEACETKAVLQTLLWHHTAAHDAREHAARAHMLDRVRTVAELFRLTLPRAGAQWSGAPAAHA